MMVMLIALPAVGDASVVAEGTEKPGWELPSGKGWSGDYAIRPKRARKSVHAVLEEAELTLDPLHEGEDLLTEFAPFTRKDFGRNVATEPPTQSPLYPFWQPIDLAVGKYRLLVRITPLGEGSRVTIIAQIIAGSINRVTYEKVELLRDSNGTIEKRFLDRLRELHP